MLINLIIKFYFFICNKYVDFIKKMCYYNNALIKNKRKIKGGNMENPIDLSSKLKNIRKSKIKNEIFAKTSENQFDLDFSRYLNTIVNNIEDEIICKQFKLKIA